VNDLRDLVRILASRQQQNGGWPYGKSSQVGLEPTCLAAHALGPGDASESAAHLLLRVQRSDGAWPAFLGDSEASWTTALAAVSVLSAKDSGTHAHDRGIRWLLETRGLEGHWFWRWKFRVADQKVRLDPDKFGWPWIPGANSWVIPTAFSLIVLKQSSACNPTDAASARIRTGVAMLLDRVCVGGGWNAGNSVVHGCPLVPHVESTAIALLALQDERPQSDIVRKSVAWLKERGPEVESPASLAWTILSLFVYCKCVTNSAGTSNSAGRRSSRIVASRCASLTVVA
jgi:hypothetical protein